ncbi:MAG: SulP family inorganic anion transporter, partial [Candidatus Falkowbacteria bacterium]|nr:SulP family inorganic anion transporter [Candidatus Falkowbacteria bacterium]
MTIEKAFPFLKWKPLINRHQLYKDLIAGLVGAIVVLPQGIAFATIAGLPPEYGLYSAMIPAIIAALWGSSRHLVSGPTTAISLVVYSVLINFSQPSTPEYIKLVLTLSFLVGAIQLILGFLKLGTLLNFISHTVVIG